MELCFQRRAVFKQEVLATVLQRLVDMTSLPQHFMGSIIQTARYQPKLKSVISQNILRRLVEREIWTEPSTWDDFVKAFEVSRRNRRRETWRRKDVPLEREKSPSASTSASVPFLSQIVSSRFVPPTNCRQPCRNPCRCSFDYLPRNFRTPSPGATSCGTLSNGTLGSQELPTMPSFKLSLSTDKYITVRSAARR